MQHRLTKHIVQSMFGLIMAVLMAIPYIFSNFFFRVESFRSFLYIVYAWALGMIDDIEKLLDVLSVMKIIQRSMIQYLEKLLCQSDKEED